MTKMAFRPTIILGDSSSGSSRALRRELFFTEPNSGRFTLRARTGHAGGRSVCGVWGGGNGVRGVRVPGDRRLMGSRYLESHRHRPTSSGSVVESYPQTPTDRVGGGGGRGSNSAVQSHFGFVHSLRPDAGDGPTSKAIGVEEWRVASGFGSKAASGRPLGRGRPALVTPAFDSEEDRLRVGFKDRGLRRIGPSGMRTSFTPVTWSFVDDGGAPEMMGTGTSGASLCRAAVPAWERSAAGGPPGPKHLVSWRDWKEGRLSESTRGQGTKAAPPNATEPRPDQRRGASERQVAETSTGRLNPPLPTKCTVRGVAPPGTQRPSTSVRTISTRGADAHANARCETGCEAGFETMHEARHEARCETRDERLERRRVERSARAARSAQDQHLPAAIARP